MNTIRFFEVLTFTGGLFATMLCLTQFLGRNMTRRGLLLGMVYLFLGIFQLCNSLPMFYEAEISLAYYRITITISILAIHVTSPLFYLYLKSIIDEDFNLTTRLLFFFLPTFMLGIILFFLQGIFPEMRAPAYVVRKYLYTEYPIYLLVPLSSVIITSIFSMDVILSCRKFRKIDSIRRGLYNIATLISGFIILIQISWVLSFLFMPEAVTVVHTMLSGCIVMFYILSSRYEKQFHPAGQGNYRKNNWKTSKLKTIDIEKSLSVLSSLMQEDKLYKNPDLKLPMLAERMGISVHQLSALINTELNCNFTSYINNIRIEEAKLLLKKGEKIPISDIIIQTGFKSSSAFFRIFKDATGLTPGEYRKVHQ